MQIVSMCTETEMRDWAGLEDTSMMGSDKFFCMCQEAGGPETSSSWEVQNAV